MSNQKILEIEMTLSIKGFNINPIEHTLIRILEKDLFEIEDSNHTRFVKPYYIDQEFSITLNDGFNIVYHLKYFTITDSEEERNNQRKYLLSIVMNLKQQTSKALSFIY